jgi:hypothetical protein
MTAPDRIWAWTWPAKFDEGLWHANPFHRDGMEDFIRRDPVVLAADPLVAAMVGAVIEEAAQLLQKRADILVNEMEALWPGSAAFKRADQRRSECIMQRNAILDLRPDATAALALLLPSSS